MPSIFSIRFTLNNIAGWSLAPELKDYFAGLVSGKNLKLAVCNGPLSPLTQYCDLFLNGTSIRDMLMDSFPECCACACAYPEARRLPAGTTETVFVTYVVSPGKFYVQIEADSKLLDDLMYKLEQVSGGAGKLTSGQLRPNMPCIALYEMDRKW